MPCCLGAVWPQRSHDGGAFFVLLCKSLDSARHNAHFQVSVEVIVSNVPMT